MTISVSLSGAETACLEALLPFRIQERLYSSNLCGAMKAFFGLQVVGRKEAAPSRPSRFAVALRASLDRSASFRRGLLKQKRRGVRW